MNTTEINIRDPFILPYKGLYYMFGSRITDPQAPSPTEFDVYISDNLEDWSDPVCVFERTSEFWADRDYWAPEVHLYNNRFYMPATFKSGTARRGTQILACDTPDGRFRPHSPCPVTPPEWDCLDGTLFFSENGTPFMVFCHEWAQIHDGTICAVQLSTDLKAAVSEPKVLWSASQAPWVSSIINDKCFVTDGPFLFKSEKQKLCCLWSSFSKGKYVIGLSISDNGQIDGHWMISDRLVYSDDGGHCMIFTDFQGKKGLYFILRT